MDHVVSILQLSGSKKWKELLAAEKKSCYSALKVAEYLFNQLNHPQGGMDDFWEFKSQ